MNGIHCEGDYRRAESEISRLNGLVDQLTYERDHYKREACQLVDSDRTNAIQQHFDLTVEEAIVVNALYKRRGKLLPAYNIEALLDDHRGGNTEASLVSQMASRIRGKLGDKVIENVRGKGYRLSPALLKRLDRKLPADGQNPIAAVGFPI